MGHDVFISYSSKDKPTADALAEALERHGIRGWLAHRDIPPGQDWAESIIDAINSSRLFILIFSTHSNSSRQVLNEIERAVNLDRQIIPFRIENAPLSKAMQYYISTSQWLDAVDAPLQPHLDRLTSTVQKILGTSEAEHQSIDFDPMSQAGTGNANLGNYQIVDELYRTPFGSVCTAKRRDDSSQAGASATFVAKIFDPSASDVSSTDSADAKAKIAGLAAFMARVRVQEKVGKSFWAPILDSGKSESKAWFITNYYPRTAQRLLSGKVVLNSASLHEIINSIVGGLAELKSACDRAHGNLKPSNILIAGRGEVAEAKVVLTDPAPGPCNTASAYADDAYAVGALLYQLVLHRAFYSTAWPVAEAEEWSQMGRGGVRWRNLCSALLDPDPKARPDLAALQTALASMKSFKLPPIKKFLGSSAGRLAPLASSEHRSGLGKVAAAVVGLSLITGGARWGIVEWEQPIRGNLAASQANWFGVLQDPAQAGPLLADPQFLKLLADDKGREDQIDAALKPDGLQSLRLLNARSIPDESQRQWVNTFKVAAAGLSEKIKPFGESGFNLPPALIQVPALSDSPSARDIITGVRQLQELEARIMSNDPKKSDRWKGFENKVVSFNTARNDFLPRCAASLRQSAARAIVLTETGWAIGPEFDACDARATELGKKHDLAFDAARFAQEENAVNLVNPSLQDMDNWLKTVDMYVVVPNAGNPMADEFRQEINGIPPASTPEFTALRNQIDGKLKDLGASQFVLKDVRQNPENHGPLYDRRLAIRNDIDLLRRIHPPEDPAVFIGALAAVKLTDEKLAGIRDARIAQLRQAPAGWEKRKEQVQSLMDLLATLDAFAPLPQFGGADDFYKTAAVKHRDAALNPLLSELGDGSSLTVAQANDLKSRANASSGECARWLNLESALADSFPKLAAIKIEILEAGASPDQRWKNSPDQANFWRTQVIDSLGVFHEQLNPLNGRFQALANFQAQNNIEEVTALASQSDPAPGTAIPASWHAGGPIPTASTAQGAEILIAAWRKLAAPSGKGIFAVPPTINSLSKEGEIRRNLAAVQQAIIDQKLTASDKLKKELDDALKGGPKRWCDALQLATKPEDIDTAMSCRNNFGLGFDVLPPPAKSVPEAQVWAQNLQPHDRYNIALYLTQDALSGKDADKDQTVGSRLDVLAATSSALPVPAEKAAVAPLANWINESKPSDADFRLQFKSVLDGKLYLFPNQQPNVLTEAMSAARRLEATKDFDPATSLLVGFVIREKSNLQAPNIHAEWSSEIMALAKSCSPQQRSTLMGSLDAIVFLGIANLRNLPDPSQAAITARRGADMHDVRAVVLLAQMYENGVGEDRSLQNARSKYELADAQRDPVAHAWLETHPIKLLAPPSPTPTPAPTPAPTTPPATSSHHTILSPQ